MTFGNLMYDRRVIRGNTYALHTLPAVIFLAFNKEELFCIIVLVFNLNSMLNQIQLKFNVNKKLNDVL